MPFDPAALLRHRDFVRAVAGSLLKDPHLVDDVEQETWATALDRPPRSQNALAAWLGKVARRLAFRTLRSRERRGRREHASSPPRPLASPDELARNLETEQRIVAAVLKLDRLYREVILLRFYEGLPPREAAARLHVPVNTVRTRTRRALELLRADLARDRRAWFVGLLPLLTPRRAALGAMLMKAKLAVVAVLLVISGALVWQLAPRESAPRADAPAVAVELPETAPRVCRLTGRVVDGAGEPVAGAQVELAAVAGVTDAAGAFALETEREGPDVLAASSGALRTQQVVELKPGDVSAGTLVLAETVTVTGVVLDVGGEGASGAVVEAWPAMVEPPERVGDLLLWARPSPPIAASTMSGEGGAFRLPLPRGSAMVLRARKGAAMTREEQGCDLRGDTGLVVLRLRAPGSLRGRVTDLAGAPVPGAVVQLLPPASTWGYVERRSVRGLRTAAAADGTFAVEALPEAYAVLVTHPDFVPFHAPRVLVPREGLTIRLSPGRRLEGLVTAGGGPAADALVQLVPAEGYAAPQETRTDGAGRFVIAHALPGRVYHVFADGGPLGSALLRDVEWQGQELALALGPAYEAQGKVVLEDGTPVGGVRLWSHEFYVRTETASFLRGYKEAVSGPDGRFRLVGVTRGEHRFVNVHPAEDRYEDLRRGNVISPDRDAVVVVAPRSRLAVQVVDAAGDPVVGAEVGTRNERRSFTDAEGRCVVDWGVEVRARKPGLRAGWAKTPRDSDEVRVTLERSTPFRGIVRDTAGNPVEHVRVGVFGRPNDVTSATQLQGMAFTDAAGMFAFDLVAASSGMTVKLERAGYYAMVVEPTAAAQPQEFVLQPARTFRGRIVDEEGAPIGGASVNVKGAIFWSQTTWTAPDGRFILEDVEPEERLALRARGYAWREMIPIKPAEGETTFVLARELTISGQVLLPDGKPSEFATVSASIEDVPGSEILARGVGSSAAAQSDKEGNFRIPGLSAGRYTLRVHPFRSDVAWEPMAGVAAGATGVVLREKPPDFVSGVVVDENDRALRGARVNLHDAMTGSFVMGDYVDDQGRFRIPVPAGKYEARVNLAGMALPRVRGVESGREGLVLRFAAGQEIRGRIGSPEGYAPGSGSVEVWSDEVHGYAEVDKSGAFAICGLPPGTYAIRAIGAARGGGEVLRASLKVPAGATDVRIELGTTGIR